MRLADKSVRPTRELGHFYNLAHFLRLIAVGRRIFGSEESSRDPKRFHFFPNTHQLLLFRPEYIVRIFHRGRAFDQNSGLVFPVEDYFKPTRSTAKPAGGT